MALITRTYDFVDGTVAEAEEVDTDLNTIYSEFNGSISNVNIASNAAIVGSKLNLAVPGAIGGTTPSTGAFTTLSATGTATLKKTVQTIATATDGATVTFDLSAGNIQQVTLGGNRTLALSNVSVGQCFIIKLIQDATGSRTVTWFTVIRWVDGVAPTLTTTAERWDVFGVFCKTSGNYDGFIVGQNMGA